MAQSLSPLSSFSITFTENAKWESVTDDNDVKDPAPSPCKVIESPCAATTWEAPPAVGTVFSEPIFEMKREHGCPNIRTVRDMYPLVHLIHLEPIMDSSSYYITLFNKPVIFKTCPVRLLFGVNRYYTKGTSNPTQDAELAWTASRLSTHISLSPNNHELRLLASMFTQIDNHVDLLNLFPNSIYCSSIRYNYRDPHDFPFLRIKIALMRDRDNADLVLNTPETGCIISPTVTDLQRYLPGDVDVICHLEILPIWSNNQYYGLNYKLVYVQTVEPEFRG